MPWFEEFLFTHTRHSRPDGRPLYAYRTTDRAFDGLRGRISAGLTSQQYGGEFPTAFCLFAAETFRREHAGGAWKWETIFQAHGLPTPPQPQIGTWIEQGLARWQRRLLTGGGGQRLFLVTIACEGGLPLRLLQQQDAQLTQFFRGLLEAYFRAAQGGPEVALQQARLLVTRLPISLRHEHVLHLAAQLIARVGELHRLVGDAPDPIARLDQLSPDWRRTLPLRLEDQVALCLLTGLLRRSAELSQQALGQPRWRGLLRPLGDGWRLERRLEFPDAPSAAQLGAWTGGPLRDAPRLRLLLAGDEGTQAIAWLTRTGEAGPNTRYRREWLHRGGAVLADGAVLGAGRLLLSDDQQEWPLATIDEDGWGPLPWVFVAQADGGAWQWLGEGSVRTRQEQALVLLPPDLEPGAASDGGCWEARGALRQPERTIYALTGTLTVTGAGAESWRISCRAEEDSGGSFVLSGADLSLPGQSRRLWRGLPRFQAVDELGGRTDAMGQVQWRGVGATGPWRPPADPGHGLLWLRLLDPQGRECCRRQVAVAPRPLRIESVIGNGEQAGALGLVGLAGAVVAARGGGDLSVNRHLDTAEIRCPVLPGPAPAPLSVTLTWSGAPPLELILPYPQRGACFDLAGQTVAMDDNIPLDRLGGLRLIVQDPAGAGYWLRIELVGAALPPVQERLPGLQQGRLDCPLYRWQERITSLLASSGALEDRVRLSVETGTGQRLARVHVSRFDALLEPDRERQAARLPETVQARLGVGRVGRLSVAMLPLWQPEAEPVVLTPAADDPDAWPIPEGLPPGPWWIVARDGDWARFRPLLWSIPARDEMTEPPCSRLAEAIRVYDPARRIALIEGALAELATAPQAPDWALLSGFIALARDLPATALDPLCGLTRQPVTLAQTLLRADDAGFGAVWSLSGQLPFLWMLLPVRDWRSAATRHFRWLTESLAGVESGADIAFDQFDGFRKRLEVRRPWGRALGDWLQEQVFPERPLPTGSVLRLARTNPALLEAQIKPAEQALMGRHDANARWPDGPEVIAAMAGSSPWMQGYRYLNLAGFYRPVRVAPFVAAHLALTGLTPSNRLVYESRLLRAFDQDWFDEVHAIALTIGLAQRAGDDHPTEP